MSEMNDNTPMPYRASIRNIYRGEELVATAYTRRMAEHLVKLLNQNARARPESDAEFDNVRSSL